jgi:hypothetical protein
LITAKRWQYNKKTFRTPVFTEILRIKLIDLNGKIILEKDFRTLTEVKVNEFPKGIYMVSITGNNISLFKRIVISE